MVKQISKASKLETSVANLFGKILKSNICTIFDWKWTWPVLKSEIRRKKLAIELRTFP